MERLYEAVNVILSYQNSDGGMATYENTRSFHALEVRAGGEGEGEEEGQGEEGVPLRGEQGGLGPCEGRKEG